MAAPCDCCEMRVLWNWHDLCYDCKKIHKEILGGNISRDLIHPKKILRITYQISEVDHDGYCSDAYNETSTTKTETRYYPLLLIFNDDDFQIHGIIKSLDNPKIFYYEIPNKSHGYCGLETTYSIKNIKLVNY
jgi:hypothetical protein